ncbi:MAG TPA: hypothetical protein VGH74_05000 [Planctomycetaceae bacterium]|jgi:hypothetical protein
MRWNRGSCEGRFVFLTTAALAISSLATSAYGAAQRVTHKQVHAIKVSGSQGATLQSMMRTSDGKLVALLGAPRTGGIGGGAGAAPQSAIQVFDEAGKELTRWNIAFPAQAVAAGPNGSIFVGGNGKIARYDADGKLLNERELPTVANMLADRDSLKQRAQEQLKSERNSSAAARRAYTQQIKVLKAQIAKIEETEVDGVTASVKRKQDGLPPESKIFVDPQDLPVTVQRKLKRLKEQLATYEAVKFPEGDEDARLAAAMQQLVQRAAKISGISATAQDVFVVTGEEQGYGFAAWRMDHAFDNATKVLTGLRGCCGQMDMQAVGNELFVAENTKHRVGRYDRDGQHIEDFGTTASKKNADGFGGCCNPMNVCCGPTGEILTAESEGIIRRFSVTGKYLGLVGRVSLTGGCKNVAVSASPDGEGVYFCDLPGSRIIMMGPVANQAEAEALAKPPKAVGEVSIFTDDEDDDATAKDDNGNNAALPSESGANAEDTSDSEAADAGPKKATSAEKLRKQPRRPVKPAPRSARPATRQPLRTRVYSDPGF